MSCNIVSEDSKKTYRVTEDILSHIAQLDQRHLEAADENITFMDYSANTYPAAVNRDPNLVILDDNYQPLDSTFQLTRLKRLSVWAFLQKQPRQETSYKIGCRWLQHSFPISLGPLGLLTSLSTLLGLSKSFS